MPPGWDGVETTCKIWEKYPDLQVVLCSAFSNYSWEEMVSKLGYWDRVVILKKPFDNIEVLQMAVAMTKRWRNGLRAKLRLENLEKLADAGNQVLKSADKNLAEIFGQLLKATESAKTEATGAPLSGKSEKVRG